MKFEGDAVRVFILFSLAEPKTLEELIVIFSYIQNKVDFFEGIEINEDYHHILSDLIMCELRKLMSEGFVQYILPTLVLPKVDTGCDFVIESRSAPVCFYYLKDS
jgi:hypothetical protein